MKVQMLDPTLHKQCPCDDRWRLGWRNGSNSWGRESSWTSWTGAPSTPHVEPSPLTRTDVPSSSATPCTDLGDAAMHSSMPSASHGRDDDGEGASDNHLSTNVFLQCLNMRMTLTPLSFSNLRLTAWSHMTIVLRMNVTRTCMMPLVPGNFKWWHVETTHSAILHFGTWSPSWWTFETWHVSRWVGDQKNQGHGCAETSWNLPVWRRGSKVFDHTHGAHMLVRTWRDKFLIGVHVWLRRSSMENLYGFLQTDKICLALPALCWQWGSCKRFSLESLRLRFECHRHRWCFSHAPTGRANFRALWTCCRWCFELCSWKCTAWTAKWFPTLAWIFQCLSQGWAADMWASSFLLIRAFWNPRVTNASCCCCCTRMMFCVCAGAIIWMKLWCHLWNWSTRWLVKQFARLMMSCLFWNDARDGLRWWDGNAVSPQAFGTLVWPLGHQSKAETQARSRTPFAGWTRQ